ncbi:outer membrane protein [Pontibaca salina]|uniref:Porin family protein n=1 Tax=Pontibaca salina TaxID=2795731 RepID=A0A934HHQ6_9RHOB|nr:outer membrane beta-barrel protein [Pontibaca salina]MBI6628369.1 porin family protein [Pontibaca salina]
MKFIRFAAIPALLAAPAFAGNLQEPVVEPIIAAPVQVQPISDWTGFYVGGQVGYGDASGGDIDVDGMLGGVHAGYMYDLGQWVVGAELDYDWADLTGEPADTKLDEVYRLKALAGYDLGNGLIYGTVGGFNANVDLAGTDYDDSGWLAGVGYKHKFTENWIGGVEVLYHDTGDFDGEAGGDVDATTITARVSYKF